MHAKYWQRVAKQAPLLKNKLTLLATQLSGTRQEGNNMAITLTAGDSGMGPEPVGRRTGGGFPPARGTRVIREGVAALPGNDKGNPVSTGRGGIPTSLRLKKAGTHDAPGTDKTVNLF